MSRGNGKTEGSVDLKPVDLNAEDAERELSGAEGADASMPSASTVLAESEKLRIERDALLDRLARLQAEFDNARKRGVREQQEFREFAAADVIKNFLPILDSFELALRSHADRNDFRSGVELIHRQFQDALIKSGVQLVAAVGQVFDPRVHEAIEMVDTTEVPDQQIVDELQRGYKYKDRLLRPAMVRVARNERG